MGTLVLVIVCGGIAFWVARNANKQNSLGQYDSSAKTTSDLPSAQEDFQATNTGDEDNAKDREPGNSIREDQGSAGITDTNGNIPPSVDTSKPTTSQTGEITVYSPQQNQSVSREIIVAGTAKIKTVMYRISDDVTGVIETGSLSVINGKFSGTLKITTGAKVGQVSFFGVQSDDNEFSNVTIPLRFN